MKKSILKSAMAVLFMSMALISCNKSNNSEGNSMESEIETPAATQESDTTSSDSTDLEKVDAARMSDGKDAVQGEVTPPTASEQK